MRYSRNSNTPFRAGGFVGRKYRALIRIGSL
jgi:hypothetical protein